VITFIDLLTFGAIAVQVLTCFYTAIAFLIFNSDYSAKGYSLEKRSKILVAGDLIHFANTWTGNDLEDCLLAVYDNRSKAIF